MANLRLTIASLLLLFSFATNANIDAISLTWHNDMFVGKDGGGYTNGIFASWYDFSTDPNDKVSSPLLTRPVAWLLSDSAESSFTTHTLGQMMSTPKDISNPDPDLNDAPYAGLLFFRSTYFLVDGHISDHVSVTLGILGPSSQAEETQKLIHKITGSHKPQGWHHQLKDEFIGQVSRGRVYRTTPLASDNVDLIGLTAISLGNLESSLGGGVIMRYGRGLATSFAAMSMLTERITAPLAVDNGWYFYIGGGTEYVYNSILVNGNTFRDSPSGNLRHEQYTLMAGLALSWSDLTLHIGYEDGSALDKLATSRETYGAISLAWRL